MTVQCNAMKYNATMPGAKFPKDISMGQNCSLVDLCKGTPSMFTINSILSWFWANSSFLDNIEDIHDSKPKYEYFPPHLSMVSTDRGVCKRVLASLGRSGCVCLKISSSLFTHDQVNLLSVAHFASWSIGMVQLPWTPWADSTSDTDPDESWCCR